MKIKIGILGYGNLARGVEQAIKKNNDTELVSVFTRRPPDQINASVAAYSINDLEKFKDKIDVMILCSGSATDLPEQTPHVASMFNLVDSYDNHSKIPVHFKNVDAAAKAASKTALISCGWDPGLFSLNRLLFNCVLPDGEDFTFWGKGVSQGHSDALRRIEGVAQAVQYTVPIDSALQSARSENPKNLTTREKHERICYVVIKEGYDKQSIETQIKTMPGYFADYNTTVNFISAEDFNKNHTTMPHGGFVIRNGKTSENSRQNLEFSLKLQSNPEFTASVLVAYARAVCRLSKENNFGAKTVFDIPYSYLTNKPYEELIATLL